MSWGIVLAALGMAAALAATYADIRATIAVQGTEIATLKRQFGQFDRDVRAKFGIARRDD